MKKIEKIFAVVMLMIVCSANAAFAVPVKVDEDQPRSTAVATEKPKATATAKATLKPTATATATPKATTKPSSKPSASPKSTSKATEAPEDDDKIVLDADDDAIVLEPTTEPTLNIQNGSEQLENKKYLTKFGAFLWFLFTVIVSAVISFAISYRFYMMGRKDNHIAAEIRALKRDIDSKMVGTVGGFSEFDVAVSNGNRSFAKENSSIHSSVTSAEADEADSEIYKKWETKINSKPSSTVNDRPTAVFSSSGRSSQGVGRRRPVKSKKTVGGKIKNVLNDIFPFDKK